MELHLFHFSQLLLSETRNMAPNASIVQAYGAFVPPKATLAGFLPTHPRGEAAPELQRTIGEKSSGDQHVHPHSPTEMQIETQTCIKVWRTIERHHMLARQ